MNKLTREDIAKTLKIFISTFVPDYKSLDHPDDIGMNTDDIIDLVAEELEKNGKRVKS